MWPLLGKFPYFARELAFVHEYIVNSAASDSAEQGSNQPHDSPAADTEPHEVLMRVVNAVRAKYNAPIAVYGS